MDVRERRFNGRHDLLDVERLDQMQLRPRIRAQANHVAGIRRNFRAMQDHVEHQAWFTTAAIHRASQ